MDKINEFLNEAGVFYLATIDGNKPRIRPIGAHFVMDNKLIFGIGSHKDVYRQILKNPNVEIVALNKKAQWLRYSGTAVFETDPKYAEYCLNKNSNLKNIYNDKTGYKLAMFHLENATALIMGHSGSIAERLL